MARRGWDDRWRRYPASRPLPAEGGLVTSRRRGAMAEHWWSRRFVEALESYGLGARMQRGRRYARTGQVLDLEVRAAVIAAQVQGSRRTPYLVTVSLPEPSAQQWDEIGSAMASKVGFAARLLAGEVPPELEDVFAAAGVALVPRAWGDLRAECSCPDWENPCKHIAAVLYIFADQLDADPWLLLAWRGRSREELLEPLRAGAAGGAGPGGVAPWWPFTPGALLPATDVQASGIAGAGEPGEPDAVLARTADPGIAVAGSPWRDLLRPAYEALLAPGEPDAEQDR